MIKTLLKKKYLRQISRVKHEKFEKCVSKLKPAWRAAQNNTTFSKAQRRDLYRLDDSLKCFELLALMWYGVANLIYFEQLR